MTIFRQTKDLRLHDRQTSCGLFLFASVPSFDVTLKPDVWTTWQFWLLVVVTGLLFSFKAMDEEGWGFKTLAVFWGGVCICVIGLFNMTGILGWIDNVSSEFIRGIFHI